MAAVTVTWRRTDRTGGNLKRKLFKITVAADGDTLATRLREIVKLTITNAQEPFTVTGTIVAGAGIAIADARITANTRLTVSRVSNAGTDGHLEVVAGAGTATVTSSEALDTSVVEVACFPPRVSGYSISGGTITFDLDGNGTDAVGVLVAAEGF